MVVWKAECVLMRMIRYFDEAVQLFIHTASFWE